MERASRVLWQLHRVHSMSPINIVKRTNTIRNMIGRLPSSMDCVAINTCNKTAEWLRMVESNVCTATHSALTTSAIIGECACRSLLPALLYELEISDLRIVQFTRFLNVPQVLAQLLKMCVRFSWYAINHTTNRLKVLRWLGMMGKFVCVRFFLCAINCDGESGCAMP